LSKEQQPMAENHSADSVQARARNCAAAIGALFNGVFGTLDHWRSRVEAATAWGAGDIDPAVYAMVGPELTAVDPLLIGAGFIAAPGVVRGKGLHFAWWLGPLEDNPILGTTTEPNQLDLASREYADYLRDLSALEWYRVPEATGARHITGPYVDHLCTCDYILTLTAPVVVDGSMAGVVGADVLVRRLERDALPLMRAVGAPTALVSAAGRVIVSTDPQLPVGTLATADAGPAWTSAITCPGTNLKVLVRTAQ
jgi:hypothetical protein